MSVRAALICLSAALALNTACGGDCGASLEPGSAEGTIDGEPWSAGEVSWGWAGSALEITTPSSEGWLLSMIAQSDLEGRDLATALADGPFPVEVDLLDGGYGILYGADGSYVSNGGGGGTLEIHSAAEGGALTACFDFTAEGSAGSAEASGGAHALAD